MTARLTRQTLGRNIRAAREAGLHVVGIAPDGTILTSETEAPPLASPPAKAAGGNSCDDILHQLTGSA